MIFRGQMVSRFSRSSLKGLSIRRNESIPLPGERVSASFSQLLGRFRLDTGAQSSSSTPISRRNYADRPVSRPKAHTGRTKSAPRKKTVGDTGKTESTGRKSSVGKAKAKSSPKAKVKAKPKKTIKRKAKPKKTTKRKPKKVLTEEQKAGLVTTKNKSKIRELKEKALKSPPSGATTAWAVYLKEQWNEIKASTQAVTLSDVVKQATTRFRELKPEETEHYNHIANQNKATFDLAYRKWIQSHTAEEILRANYARSALRRKGYPTTTLKDERKVKSVRNAFIQYVTERLATGDYKGISTIDRAKLIGKEWKELSEEGKKKWKDLATLDQRRYLQEKNTVYKSNTKSPAA